MKMKQIITIIGIFSLLFLVACVSPTETVEDTTEVAESDVEAIAEPTAEQIESDLDTSSLDEIEEDLDLLILE